MTLKEKFSNLLPWYSEKDNNDEPTQCEKIADDYAIGFAEWLNEEYSYYHGDGEYYDHTKNKWYKLKELLEIYKKEKGL